MNSLDQITGPTFPYPNTPAGLKQAVAVTHNIRAVRREYWWTGAPHYQLGINGGLVGQAFNVVGANNATPILITTDKLHGLNDGDPVTIKGVVGNTAANIAGFAKVSGGEGSLTSFSLYNNSDLAVAHRVAGNGAYTDGGTVQGPKSNGESADLFSLTGSGCVTSITLTLGVQATINDAQLWIYTDGDSAGSPSFKLALCDLCCVNCGGVSYNNAAPYVQSSRKIGNGFFVTDNLELENSPYDAWNQTSGPSVRVAFRYPIPFSTACRATLVQLGSFDNTSTNTFCITEWTPDVTSPLRLQCTTTPALDMSTAISEGAVMGGADFTILNAPSGPGWIVGTGVAFNSWNNDGSGSTVLERNIFVFRDGETQASYQTTGTEDYWGSSYYFGNQVTRQLWGAFVAFWRPSGTGNAQFAADVAYFTGWKDNLQSDNGGIRFTNGCLMKSMYNPDGAARILSNANGRTVVLTYR